MIAKILLTAALIAGYAYVSNQDYEDAVASRKIYAQEK